jgi:hypothetical protein
VDLKSLSCRHIEIGYHLQKKIAGQRVFLPAKKKVKATQIKKDS